MNKYVIMFPDGSYLSEMTRKRVNEIAKATMYNSSLLPVDLVKYHHPTGKVMEVEFTVMAIRPFVSNES